MGYIDFAVGPTVSCSVAQMRLAATGLCVQED